MSNILVIGANSTVAKEVFNLLQKENHTIYSVSRDDFDFSKNHLRTSLDEKEIDWPYEETLHTF